MSHYVYDVTMHASTIVRMLDMALDARHPHTIASATKRTQRETEAVLRAHGWPYRAQMLDWRAKLAPLGKADVCFDVAPFRKRGKDPVDLAQRTPCPVCGKRLLNDGSVRVHAWRQHEMRAAEVRALMEAAS